MLIHRIYEHGLSRVDLPAISIGGARLGYRAFAMVIEATRRFLESRVPHSATIALIAASGVNGWSLSIAARALGLHALVLNAPKQIHEFNFGARAVVLTLGDTTPPPIANAAHEAGTPTLAIPSSAFDATPEIRMSALPSDDACGGYILLTSGTTGVYKKVLIDCAAEAARAAALMALFHTNTSSVLYMGPLGLWTSAGQNRPILTWYAGGRVVFPDSSDIARPLLQEGVTQLQITVPMLAEILERLPFNFKQDNRIRLGFVGSSPSWRLVEQARAMLTTNINSELGSTEAGTIASTPLETPDDLRFHRLIPEREVIIVDERDQVLPHGRAGLVKVRLRKSDARAYFEAPEETARFFQGEWFLPGDIGRIDARGRLELLGRVTDVISIWGDKHSTLPFEQAIEQKLGVTAAAVFSAPNADGNDEIHVVIESGDPHPPTPGLAAMFPSFARVHTHFVEKMPRNHMGKIDRLALRRMLRLD